ncbi:FtsX-like permease family protein [Collinsella sp. D33t1_170424_A12]|uniref:FtsX-like permease family protein n=1 Tax=Collinsella sp. D33t1_170424_A12 TaxID=2787135 RepID=UPI001E5FF6C4|nr:FtsX-like permease family protein [Collinsella sp. D33t1_170424_A12]
MAMGKKDCRAAKARPNAFTTDIKRTITGNLKRFISLFVITALGTTMFVGLKAACDDLRATADSYYDEQRLFDISVQSTLGLDGADIAALAALEGVDEAEGGYTETAYTQVDGRRAKVDLKALSAAGINEPRVLEGRLPRDVGEVAVTQRFLDASGKRVGDTVTFAGADEGEPSGDAPTGAGDEAAGSQDGAATDAASMPIFKRGTYTITGAVLDPTDVNAGTKTMSFRAGGGAQFAFFLTPAAVRDRDTFTVAYLTVAGAAELPTYSDEYDELVDEVKQRVEAAREAGASARTDRVRADALGQIEEKQREAEAQLAEADEQLAGARGQVADALAQIEAGRRELERQGASAESQLDAAQKQLDASSAQLDAAWATVQAKQAELDEGAAAAEDSLKQIERAEAGAATLKTLMGEAWPADAWARLQAGDASAREPFVSAVSAYTAEAVAQIDQASRLLDAVRGLLDKLPATPGVRDELLERIDGLAKILAAVYPDAAGEIERVRALVASYVAGAPSLDEAHASLDRIAAALADLRIQIDAAGSQAGQLADAVLAKPRVEAALAAVASGRRQLASARDEVVRGQAQLEAGRAQLDAKRADARRQLAAGADELAAGAAEAADGRAELERNEDEFQEKKLDAEARFADARAEVDGIEGATWYIQDRSSLPSYASVESDAKSIESIATVFPLIFFTVAVLISLTTVTRMVEEDRGLIGVYKALGYSKARILSKYVIYAFAACVTGGIAGDLFGFVALPEVIFTIFATMYALPPFQLHFNLGSALMGVSLFAIGIVGATFLACRYVLRETPASLMRPKAPRAGKRIVLERITPLWRRMSFLNKVSARNLFRYKKRFLMTVFGIAGCTALMICGLGIRDTVISLKPRQYGEEGIVRYDLLAVTADDNFARAQDELRATGRIDQMLEARIDSATASFNDARESVQIIVVPRDADLSAYLKMEDGSATSPVLPATGGDALELPRDSGVLITKNAEQVLGFSVGDAIELQDSAMRAGTVEVRGIAVNFLGNFVFMTEDAYAAAFGERCAPNGFLANLQGTDDEKIALADELAAGDTFVTVSSSTKIANDFSDSFKIIDVVVYVVTIMAGALAFAVVFTLSTTNISERERELATIKVLGFRRREVYRYINKETIVLTLIGIVAGWPLGYLITRFLTYVLRMPSLFFDTIVEPQTYLFASVMSLVFTLVINAITNRALDRVDMVGALKSAE